METSKLIRGTHSGILQSLARAAQMVLEQTKQYALQWAAIASIAPMIGCAPHTLLRKS
jgi:hypothetical protein